MMPSRCAALTISAASGAATSGSSATGGGLPERPRVAVLDGTQENGLANRVAKALAASGYDVVGTGSAENPDRQASWLFAYGNTAPATRQALAQAFSITADHVVNATGQAGSGGANLVVLLGTDVAQSFPAP